MAQDSVFEGPPTRRRSAFATVGLACLVGAALVLIIGADTSPTTLDTRRLFGLWRARHAGLAGGLGVLGIASLVALRSRPGAWSIVHAVVIAALAFGVLELAGRVGLVSWERVFNRQFGDLGSLGVAPQPSVDLRGTSRMDTGSIWGMKTNPMPYHFKTDRRGFRNDPHRDEADVYLIGDSMLVGALVPFEKTLVARTEAVIERPVMQVALINTAPQTMQHIFLEQRLPLNGRTVVQFVFEGNDLLDTSHLQQGPGKGRSANWQTKSLLDLSWQVVSTLTEPTLGIARTRSCTIRDEIYTFYWTRPSFAGVEAMAPVITEHMQTFRKAVEAQGGRYMAVLIPSKLRALAPQCTWPEHSELRDVPRHLGPMRDHLVQWGRHAGVPVLDLTETLQAASREGRIPWMTLDTHWSEAGHEQAAQALATWLSRENAATAVKPLPP